MSTIFPPQPAGTFPALRSLSMGAKFFLILLLAAFMSLPGFYMDNLTTERAQQHHAVSTDDHADHEQPPQSVLGIHLADSYRCIHRSLKYITLFLGLVFLTYFLFEARTGRRIHAGQYALVGVAQIIFYLLLLSLAEHIGFDFAFLIAGGATVTLFAVNTHWVFLSRKLATRAFIVFATLYALIYVLLRLENYALLVGSVASFSAVALAMYLTRSLDWHSSTAAATANGARAESWLD